MGGGGLDFQGRAFFRVVGFADERLRLRSLGYDC